MPVAAAQLTQYRQINTLSKQSCALGTIAAVVTGVALLAIIGSGIWCVKMQLPYPLTKVLVPALCAMIAMIPLFVKAYRIDQERKRVRDAFHNALVNKLTPEVANSADEIKDFVWENILDEKWHWVKQKGIITYLKSRFPSEDNPENKNINKAFAQVIKKIEKPLQELGAMEQ